MKKLNLDDLKFNYEMKKLDNDIAQLKAEINEKLDSYFIDEDKVIYDVMMKSYTGGKQKAYPNTEKTDIKRYNEYKNPFLDRFKGFDSSKNNNKY